MAAYLCVAPKMTPLSTSRPCSAPRGALILIPGMNHGPPASSAGVARTPIANPSRGCAADGVSCGSIAARVAAESMERVTNDASRRMLPRYDRDDEM